MKKITLSLNTGSIVDAIKELNEYRAWVKRKTKQLTERLAMIGAREATVRFSRAYYTGKNDVSVNAEPTKNGWKITAEGEAVCFIEFGAGVYYNGTEPYPMDRPSGVVGIGEYGSGRGKQDSWVYNDESGEPVWTHGTPAAMPMYYATREMEQEILTIAREVFKD